MGQEQGARWFDFYGVPGKVELSHPLYGLYYFKKSLAASFVPTSVKWIWFWCRSLLALVNCYPLAREMLAAFKRPVINYFTARQNRI